MATITFNIPDDKIQDIINAFASSINMYYDQVNNPDFDPSKPEDPTTNPKTIPNPVSKSKFTKQCIIDYIKRTVKEHKAQGFNTQIKQASDEVDAINIQ